MDFHYITYYLLFTGMLVFVVFWWVLQNRQIKWQILGSTNWIDLTVQSIRKTSTSIFAFFKICGTVVRKLYYFPSTVLEGNFYSGESMSWKGVTFTKLLAFHKNFDDSGKVSLGQFCMCLRWKRYVLLLLEATTDTIFCASNIQHPQHYIYEYMSNNRLLQTNNYLR